MNEHGLISKMLMITVAVIMIAVLLVPVVNSAASEVTTEVQNTTERYTMSSSANSEPVVIESTSTALTYLVNGREVVIPSSYFSIGFSDSAVIRYRSAEMQIITETGRTNSVSKIVYDSGVATVTTPSGDIQYSWDYLFYPSNDGDWGCFEHLPGLSEPLHLNNDVSAYFIANIVWNEVREYAGLWEIKNGEVINELMPLMVNSTGYNQALVKTDSVVTLQYESSDRGIAKTYYGGTITTSDFTSDQASYIIAPIAYMTVTDSDSGLRSLYLAIPTILIAALVIVAVQATRIE